MRTPLIRSEWLLLLATTGGSSWYHLAPDEAGLAVDRLGMSIAFAGLLGLAAAAAAALPVVAPLLAAARSGQNGAQYPAGTHAAVAGPRQA